MIPFCHTFLKQYTPCHGVASGKYAIYAVKLLTVVLEGIEGIRLVRFQLLLTIVLKPIVITMPSFFTSFPDYCYTFLHIHMIFQFSSL